MDITYIPKEFINNEDNSYYNQNINYKYILTVCDHFSKFADSYLLTDKKATTVLDKFNNFCEFFGYPEQLGVDNGKEFINNLLSEYLKKII